MKNLPQKRLQVSNFSCGEECSFGFFLKKEQKINKIKIHVACLAKESNLTRGSNGKYKNLMEITSNLNVLIIAYNKLKSNPGKVMGMGLYSENTKRY
jgi:hypothetical protein